MPTELFSFVKKKVRISGTENQIASTRPRNVYLLRVSGSGPICCMLKKPRVIDTKTNEDTIPTEFIMYSIDLYCVLSEYSGASSGSIAV